MTMQGKTVTCRDCNRELTLTRGEQEFFAQKGFTSKPGRRPECRATNKTSRGGGGYSSGRYERLDREAFPAVCTECGKGTQVPFPTSGDRPGYCSVCFSAQRSSSGGGYRGRDGNRRSR